MPKKPVLVSISDEQLAWLDAKALSLDISRAALFRRLVDRAMALDAVPPSPPNASGDTIRRPARVPRETSTEGRPTFFRGPAPKPGAKK